MLCKQYFVYILASKLNGTLYIGVTGDLVKRVHQHRENLVQGFTKRYAVHRLVYYEIHHEIYAVIIREKQIKKWRRQWKINLMELSNPEWNDLYEEFCR